MRRIGRRDSQANRSVMRLGASSLALTVALTAMPAHAQLMRLRGNIPSPTATAGAVTAGTIQAPSMRQAMQQQATAQARAAAMRGYVTSLRQAANSAIVRANPTNGIGSQGLYPIAQVREVMALRAAGQQTQADALLASLKAASDTSAGKSTWEGARDPVETVNGGQTTVSITQTQERAILTWNRMDVGAQTTLQFVQKDAAGNAQPGWIALNRVVDSTDPTTILGRIQADGAVYIINPRNVIFGKGSQVNLSSLVASTLEIGKYANSPTLKAGSSTSFEDFYTAASVRDRNISFLQNGPFANNTLNLTGGGALVPIFLSASIAPGSYDSRTLTPPTFIDNTTLGTGVFIDPGATITTATAGGYLVFAGPSISNAGILSALDGQISLQAGQIITYAQSTGADTSIDRNVRGTVFRTVTNPINREAPPEAPRPQDGVILNTGYIQSRRGYLSLGTGAYGEITNSGLLEATTSVSRNGFIRLNAGTITMVGNSDAQQAGGVTILPEETGETVPQGDANNPPTFKASQIEIGARGLLAAGGTFDFTSVLGSLLPATVTFGENSLLYAPGANVTIGASLAPLVQVQGFSESRANTPVTIAANALLDVSGLKDVQVDGSRYIITITPVKRNELRDTPTYREVAIGDEFTLNGQTITVDVRKSGVRDDGVRWVGSPLIEAGSLATQIPQTVSEFLTKGGTISLVDRGSPFAFASSATINVSGGWVHYTETSAQESRLVTADGRIVSVSQATQNDNFVDVLNGFVAEQPRFGIRQIFSTPVNQPARAVAAFDEGRDAGALLIAAPTSLFDGIILGSAYAGSHQRADAVMPTIASTIAGDPRKLQASATNLPSGAFLSIKANGNDFDQGGDIIIYHGQRGTGDAFVGETMLNDVMLSNAGLSALTLVTTGAITVAGATPDTQQSSDAYTFTGAANLVMAAGGTVQFTANRSILIDGSITAAAGTINLATITYQSTALPIYADERDLEGSMYTDEDDIAATSEAPLTDAGALDLIVNGTLSTAGLWSNDFLNPFSGNIFTNGGSISLSVASGAAGSGVFIPNAASTRVFDLSGALVINNGALIDVSAGGYVSPQAQLRLTSRAGSIALRAATVYTSLRQTNSNQEGTSSNPLYGEAQSVDFTTTDGLLRPVVAQLVPDAENQRARVSLADGTLKGFGFTRGADFTLVAPGATFNGSSTDPLLTVIPLDFLQTTGFGSLNLVINHSTTVKGLFNNGKTGNSAFLDTTTFRIGANQTLDLSTSLMPFVPLAADQSRLIALDNGASVRTVLAAVKPSNAYEAVPVSLTLGGTTELVVDAGGTITGAAQASITAPKIVNNGTIRIHGGTISVSNPVSNNRAVYVASLDDFFGASINGQYDEDADNPLFSTATERMSNRAVLTANGTDKQVIIGGEASRLARSLSDSTGYDLTGIWLGASSVTDLSGVALFDPRAAILGTRQLVAGRVVAGGAIRSPALTSGTGLFDSRTLNARPGATINLDGASGVYDVLDTRSRATQQLQWSDGGTLAFLSGGSILAGTNLSAHGGATGSTGGTLEIVSPILSQTFRVGAPAGSIFADQIQQAGFDTFIADQALTIDGNVTLQLGKAFVLRALETAVNPNAANGVIDAIVRTDQSGQPITTNIEISAPYIRLESPDRSVQPRFDTTPSTGAANLLLRSGAAGFDMFNGVRIGVGIKATTFDSIGDFRLSATMPSNVTLREFQAAGALIFNVGRVYASTGTGQLQRTIESGYQKVDPLGGTFKIQSASADGITFLGDHINRETPLSAGSSLSIIAPKIVQNGHVAAPIGSLTFGDANTQSITFGAGSITSVYGGTQAIPYGTTLDLTALYYDPIISTPLHALPSGSLTITGGKIDIQEGASVKLGGGADTFAYEFVSGVGGSRDVLSRFNNDPFSSNAYDPKTGIGYQYADKRQVYAIVPAAVAAAIALYDPLYSADYGSAGPADLYGAQAGLAITIDGSSALAAGQYVLMPAHYALLPGALRVVENVGQAAPAAGDALTLRDGSVLVGGVYSTAGTSLTQSQRRSFTLQTKDVYSKYSDIRTSSGSATIVKQAAENGYSVTRLPSDAGSVILAPLQSLKVSGLFDTTRDVSKGQRGATVDISAVSIAIGPDDAAQPRNFTLITDTTLNALNAESLFIGGTRTQQFDGTTKLTVTANQIDVLSGASLAAPELLFATGPRRNSDPREKLVIGDNVTLTATGALGNPTDADYVIESGSLGGSQGTVGGVLGDFFRLANGPDRLLRRNLTATGEATREIDSGNAGLLQIGKATITGDTVTLDTTKTAVISSGANFQVKSFVLGGPNLQLGVDTTPKTFLDTLANAQSVTLASSNVISLNAGTYSFKALTFDTPGLTSTTAESITINADSVRFRNKNATSLSCGAAGALACGGADVDLIVNATAIAFGDGDFNVYGFGGGTTLRATSGMTVEGKGSFNGGGVTLNLQTPQITERGKQADPTKSKERIDYVFTTVNGAGNAGTIVVDGTGLALPTDDTSLAAPGARIAFGTDKAALAAITVNNARIRSTAGIVELNAVGNVALTGNATLATPGYTRTFGDADGVDANDRVTLSANAGLIAITSNTGNIAFAPTATLINHSASGAAGALSLIAKTGAVTGFDAITLNPGVTRAGTGSLTFSSALDGFDLSGFLTRYGNQFGGDVAIYAGRGDLTMDAGQTLVAKSVLFTADDGRVVIDGTINTAGQSVAGVSDADAAKLRIDGGNISLFGQYGVALGAGALLDAHTSGYADTDTRVAKGGTVSIGIGNHANAALVIDDSARIDVGARRVQTAWNGTTGARLVPQSAVDPVTQATRTIFRYVEADTGGSVVLRAPLIGSAFDTVNVAVKAPSSIIGASNVELDAYREFDLGKIASSGAFSGVSIGTVTSPEAPDGKTYYLLDTVTSAANRPNFLADDAIGADGTPTLVRFVRGFSATATPGSDLTGVRLRPGIDLVGADHGILLQTNWNLAAADIDVAAAANPANYAGGLTPDLIVNTNLSTPTSTVYSVADGHEGHLLENFANFYYRVGGKFSGEAPVLTLRGKGDVVAERSISDGFFVFRDRTDPTYVSTMLGGGYKHVAVGLSFKCGKGKAGTCGSVDSFDDAKDDPRHHSAIRITLNRAKPGSVLDSEDTAAPYSNAANSPSAQGTMPAFDQSSTIGGMAGASLSFGDVLPNLSDGSAPHSSSINLVAGAANVTGADGTVSTSADLLRVDRSIDADVIVRDVAYSLGQTLPTAYALNVTVKGGFYSDTSPLELISGKKTDLLAIAVKDFLADAANHPETAGLDGDSFTNLSFGRDKALREAAKAFFAETGEAVFKGAENNPSGVFARLSQVVAFLQFYEKVYVPGVASGAIKAAKPGNNGSGKGYGKNTAAVQTVVRTGDGTINLAASSDVDLRGSEVPIYQNVLTGKLTSALKDNGTIKKPGKNDALFGGTSVYTVGHRVQPGTVTAEITRAIGSLTSAAGGGRVSMEIPASLVTQADPLTAYVPSPFGGTAAQPLALTGGGAISVAAGGSVLGQRDLALEGTGFTAGDSIESPYYTDEKRAAATETAGAWIQRWRAGSVGLDTSLLIVPQYFSSGIGALGGGNVTVTSGAAIDDLAVVLDSSIVTGTVNGSATLFTFGSGNLTMSARNDIVGARIDVAHGRGDISTLGSVTTKAFANGITARNDLDASNSNNGLLQQTTRLRVTDANLFVTARDSIFAQLQSIDNFLTNSFSNGEGNLSAIAGADLRANGDVSITAPVNISPGTSTRPRVALLPGSLTMAALDGSITVMPRPAGSLVQDAAVLYPSPIGQLQLYAENDINALSIAMLDNDPTVMNGPLSARVGGADQSDGGFGVPTRFPGIDESITEAARRLLHNPAITHLNDSAPAQIFTRGSINVASINLPKAARIIAGSDIINTYFVGQNTAVTDLTRVAAGRDIRTTLLTGQVDNSSPVLGIRAIQGFILGGPGTLSVEAGRNIGAFPSSGTITPSAGVATNYTSGILTVGNDYNPWLPAKGADITVAFGVAPGYDFANLQAVYLDPAAYFAADGTPVATLDGDLFVQVQDAGGNDRPDRTKPIYAPILASWLRDNAPDAFGAVFAGQSFASDVALADASYGRYADLYAAFQTLPQAQQRTFLIQQVFFNELKAPALPTGPSFNQYIRGYRAIEALFPSAKGYTDNLAVYDVDPATINEDHPQGVPVRQLINGQPAVADRVLTGSADFRLASIQTTRGGNVSILAPGGDLIVGSQTRTQALVSGLLSAFPGPVFGQVTIPNTTQYAAGLPISTLPISSEGILTLRSGSIFSFTDGDLRLNQSRLFTNQGGNITAWSSNGDLAAGQGPKSASSFPPITVRFDLNGFPAVDVAGTLSGAGIAAFKQSPTDPNADIVLIAPVGLVDAGDAGVRSSGNVFVAAARVANADNFAAGGTISGVPTGAPAAVAAPSTDPTQGIAAQVARSVNDNLDRDRPSQITVDILGYTGGEKCADGTSTDENCPR